MRSGGEDALATTSEAVIVRTIVCRRRGHPLQYVRGTGGAEPAGVVRASLPGGGKWVSDHKPGAALGIAATSWPGLGGWTSSTARTWSA